MNLINRKHIALFKYFVFLIITLAVLGKTIQKTIDSISNTKYELVENTQDDASDDEIKKIDFLITLFSSNEIECQCKSNITYKCTILSKFILKIYSPPPELSSSIS